MTDSILRIRDIVSNGLCHRCGACAGVCPEGIISPGEDYYPRWEGSERACTDCGLCVRACPGESFPFPDFSRRLMGRAARPEDDRGVFRRAFLGYAADERVRERSTSGGIATQLPLFLLSGARARGAVVVGTDREHPWKPRAFIARSREEILRGHLSKYPTCSVTHLVKAIREEQGPFVFTGLPCQVQGLRKIADLMPSVGRRIALTIGLLCHSALDHQAIKDLLDIYSIDEAGIERVEYRSGKLPGYIRALGKDGRAVYLPYPRLGRDRYRPNAKECLTFFFKFYSPPRCRLCIDATSEFADISVGDPWIRGWEAVPRFRKGYNLVLARSERGLELLEEARKAGAIVLEPFAEESALKSHSPMVRIKRERAFFNIERRRRRGMPVPEYGWEWVFSPIERVRIALHAATYFAADRPRLRRLLFRLLLSRPGRLVVGAAFFRKRVLSALWQKSKRLLTKKDGLRFLSPAERRVQCRGWKK